MVWRSRWMLVVSSICEIVALSQAQISVNTTCLQSFEYLLNKNGQSPCLVAAFLGSTCNGGQYDLGALETGEYYSVAAANLCQCNTVMYSMISACSACQNSTITSWSAWNAPCSNVYVGIFPKDIPAGTSVPAWAYLNVTTTATFNPQVAIGNTKPESTASNPPHAQTDTPDVSFNGCSSKKTGAIVRGVIAGIILLASVGGFIFVRKFRRRGVVFRSGSGSSRAQDVDVLMMEADPYILETATHSSASGSRLEAQHMLRKGLALRSLSLLISPEELNEIPPPPYESSSESQPATDGKIPRAPNSAREPHADADPESFVEVDSIRGPVSSLNSPMTESPTSVSEYESLYMAFIADERRQEVVTSSASQ